MSAHKHPRPEVPGAGAETPLAAYAALFAKAEAAISAERCVQEDIAKNRNASLTVSIPHAERAREELSEELQPEVVLELLDLLQLNEGVAAKSIADLAAIRRERDALREALVGLHLEEALEYEGRLEANVTFTVDALHAARAALALARGEQR